jgi:hypothetical protein
MVALGRLALQASLPMADRPEQNSKGFFERYRGPRVTARAFPQFLDPRLRGDDDFLFDVVFLPKL